MNQTARTIAALCVSGRSIYKHLPNVQAYDTARDARTFSGGMPVIAHPPCRCWSKYLRHQAKPIDRKSEMQLGIWCAEQVIANGGVLEQPAHSRLFETLHLPTPNHQARDPFLYAIHVNQSWFGYPTRKPTWLLISGVPPGQLPPLPFSLDKQSIVKSTQLSHAERSRTLPSFAEWLCLTARSTWKNLPVQNWAFTGERTVDNGVAFGWTS